MRVCEFLWMTDIPLRCIRRYLYCWQSLREAASLEVWKADFLTVRLGVIWAFSYRTVKMRCEQWENENSHARRTGSKSGRQTSMRECHLIEHQTRTTATTSSSTMQRLQMPEHAPFLSGLTYWHPITDLAFNSQPPSPPFAVLPWTTIMETGKLKRIVSSDESCFCLGFRDCRVWVGGS